MGGGGDGWIGPDCVTTVVLFVLASTFLISFSWQTSTLLKYLSRSFSRQQIFEKLQVAKQKGR